MNDRQATFSVVHCTQDSGLYFYCLHVPIVLTLLLLIKLVESWPETKDTQHYSVVHCIHNWELQNLVSRACICGPMSSSWTHFFRSFFIYLVIFTDDAVLHSHASMIHPSNPIIISPIVRLAQSQLFESRFPICVLFLSSVMLVNDGSEGIRHAVT